MKKLMHAIQSISSTDLATMRSALAEQIKSSIVGTKHQSAERTNWPEIANAIKDHVLVGAVGYAGATPELRDAKVSVVGADGKSRMQTNTSERFENLWADAINEAIPASLGKDERDSRLNVAGVRKNRLKKLVGLSPDNKKKEHCAVTLADASDPDRLGKANIAWVTALATKLSVSEGDVMQSLIAIAADQGVSVAAATEGAETGVSALDSFL